MIIVAIISIVATIAIVFEGQREMLDTSQGKDDSFECFKFWVLGFC